MELSTACRVIITNLSYKRIERGSFSLSAINKILLKKRFID